jgi:flagellar biosynthetic protein FlhB
MAGEKTEAPTPKRLQDARKKGQVSKSEEVVSIGVLLVAVLGMRALGPGLWSDMRDMLHEGLANPTHEELTTASAYQLGKDSATHTILALLPFLGLLSLAAIAFNIAQTGFMLTGAGLKPNINRINPGAGLKRLISIDGLVRLGKSLGKMSIVSIVVWLTLKSRIAELSGLSQFGVAQASGRMATLAFDVALRAAVALFILAVADYAWQRRKFMKQMKMSKEELKQEMRESDGDPQIKAAIRRKRQQLMNRMIAAVPKADVVVTNPTHYAVALKYDPVTMQAPMVIAKGERLLAQRIKEVARKAGVPVLEEPPLARALYAAVPVGQHIPANLFHAVAEVLAWVYALRTKTPFARSRAAAAGLGGSL